MYKFKYILCTYKSTYLPKIQSKIIALFMLDSFHFFTAIIPNASSLCTLNVGKIERFYDKLLTESTYNRYDKIRKEKYVIENYSAMVYRYGKYFHFKETIKSY